jgi:hypothetical protein
VSSPEEKIADALTLIHDAHLEGQLKALRKAHERVGERLRQLNGLIVTAAHPAGRVKARGSCEALEQVMLELDDEIKSIELERS